MVCALDAANESKEPFKPVFKLLLDNAVKYGIDNEYGGIYRDGEVIDGNIGNEWKVAYHSGRSMLECNRRLEKLIKSKHCQNKE